MPPPQTRQPHIRRCWGGKFTVWVFPLVAWIPTIGLNKATCDGYHLTILYTCDIRGVLQACGCSSVQFGGLAKQAALLGVQRKSSKPTLTIAGGNLAPDAARALVALQCLKAADYDAVVLTSADEESGDRFLKEAVKVGVPLVGTVPGSERLLLKDDGPVKFAITGIRGDREAAMDSLKAAFAQPGEQHIPLLIVCSECGAVVDRAIAEWTNGGVGEWANGSGVDVILFSRGLAKLEWVGKVHLIPAPEGGKEVCRVDVTWKNNECRVQTKLLPITNDLPEDKRVAAIIARYYAEQATRLIADDSQMRPADELTQPYADRDQCVDCHQTMVKTVSGHKHSRAAETLKEKERLVSECLTCHSELYRRTQRWHPDGPLAWNGVECAACHGDGILHSQIGTKESVTRKVPESVCRGCHTPEQDPGFNYEAKLKSIQHWR